MTEPKKYRTDWTIERAASFMHNEAPGVQYYRHQIDMDNVHYCSTVEEAERDIDDAIILEQEQVIEKFRVALLASNYLLESVVSNNVTAAHLFPDQITENQNLINAFKS